LKKVSGEIKNKYPGSWLYSRKVLEWLFVPEYRSQLPLLYRVFAICSQLYFWFTDSDYFMGGRRLFLAIVSIRQFLFKWNYAIISVPSFRICVDLTDLRFLNVVNEFLKEKSDTRILGSLLSPGDTFIDIGANHGSFSVIASRLVGTNGLVVAVEPQPRLIYAINTSLKNNSFCPYKVLHTAVGNYDGEIEFLIPTDSSGSAGVFKEHSARHHHKKFSVQIKKFDSLIDWKSFPGKVVLKLDIEGSENAFLEGAGEMLRTLKPTLILEINPKSIQASGIKGEILVNLIKELGYVNFAYLKMPGERLSVDELSANKFANVILFHN